MVDNTLARVQESSAREALVKLLYHELLELESELEKFINYLATIKLKIVSS